MVELQNAYSCSTDRRQSFNRRANQAEVLGPDIASRVKQPCEFGCCRVEARDVRPLVAVAKRTIALPSIQTAVDPNLHVL